jgi:hypothetical protein
MATVFRHGGEAHVVRPDRVYRTSVLSPMVGFDPTADVQANAMAFTQGPPLGMMLSGLGAGPFQMMWLRAKTWWAARKTRKFMFAGLGGYNGFGNFADPNGGGARAQAAEVAPQIRAQMHMLMALTQGANPGDVHGPVARAARTLARRRPYEYYYAG